MSKYSENNFKIIFQDNKTKIFLLFKIYLNALYNVHKT